MKSPLKAAIVGLGQVGIRFDRDTKRKGVWTHFTAYEKMPRQFNLVAACDPIAENRNWARKRKKINLYSSLTEMLKKENLDVISLCTPPGLHSRQIIQAAPYVKGIICEKPLGTKGRDSAKALKICHSAGAKLAVNFYKRFEPGVLDLKKYLRQNKLGKINWAVGAYSGPFEAVGSHMVDLLRHLFGPLTPHQSVKRKGQVDAISSHFTNKDNLLIDLRWTGPREKLIFELDVVGEKGRYRLLDNLSRAQVGQFKPSLRYKNYQELTWQERPIPEFNDRFMPLFRGLHESLRGRPKFSNLSSQEALETQNLMDSIQRNIKWI